MLCSLSSNAFNRQPLREEEGTLQVSWTPGDPPYIAVLSLEVAQLVGVSKAIPSASSGVREGIISNFESSRPEMFKPHAFDASSFP